MKKAAWLLLHLVSSLAFAQAELGRNNTIPPLPSKAKTINEGVETSTKLIPLPIYATLPNEGDTWGFMPVFLVVEKPTQRTQAIYAPSVSWNRLIGTTGTFRRYYYPKPFQTLTITGGASTHVNWGALVIWEDRPTTAGEWTNESSFRFQRTIFPRFFGIGPESLDGAESSYVRIRGDWFVREGYNLNPNWNVGLKLELQRMIVQREHAYYLPLSQDVFPNTPGMASSTMLGETLGIRYDTRADGDYSTQGWYAELQAGLIQGLSNTPNHVRLSAEGRVLQPELEGVQGAARAFWGYVSSPQVPFYFQNTLGGSYYLRGFTEDRFIDQGAWEVELEQRITMFQTHIYDVTTNWRVDPFVAIGQVYHDGSEMFAHVRYATGLGFRAWVQPNVLGRVDVATGFEGLKIYVELGYPF